MAELMRRIVRLILWLRTILKPVKQTKRKMIIAVRNVAATRAIFLMILT